MNYLVFSFARRYLVSKKTTNAINVISAVAVAAMAVIVTCLVVILSVFNGFEDLVISLYNSFNPDILVSAEKGKTFTISEDKLHRITSIEGVSSVSKTLEENALLRYDKEQYIATIKGVESNYNEVSGIDSTISRGVFSLNPEKNEAVIGAGIEAYLSINIFNKTTPISIYMPKRGNKVSADPMQAFNRRIVYPSGVFSIQQEFDLKYVIVPIQTMRDLLDYENEISFLEIKSEQKDVAYIKTEIGQIMGEGYKIQDRFEQNEVLYRIMKIEKWAVYLIGTLILIIAAFNIIGSLSMLVIEKKQDIGILKAMGAENKLIHRIFFSLSFLMALIGGGVGIFLGLLICWLQQTFEFVQLQGSGSFVINAYPVNVEITDLLLIFGTLITITMLASWYPSLKASKEDILAMDT